MRRLLIALTLLVPTAATAQTYVEPSVALRLDVPHAENEEVCVVLPKHLRDEAICDDLDLQKLDALDISPQGAGIFLAIVRRVDGNIVVKLLSHDVFGHGSKIDKPTATEILGAERRIGSARPLKDAYALDPEERRLPNGVQIWLDDFQGRSKQFEQVYKRSYLLIGGRGGALMTLLGPVNQEDQVRDCADRFVRSVRMPAPRGAVRDALATAAWIAASALLGAAIVMVWRFLRRQRRREVVDTPPPATGPGHPSKDSGESTNAASRDRRRRRAR